MASATFAFSAINNLESVSLDQLKTGERAKIERIGSDELEVALLTLGVAVGDSFILSGQAPWGGPLALSFSHTKLALRARDAEQIWISRS